MRFMDKTRAVLRFAITCIPAGCRRNTHAVFCVTIARLLLQSFAATVVRQAYCDLRYWTVKVTGASVMSNINSNSISNRNNQNNKGASGAWTPVSGGSGSAIPKAESHAAGRYSEAKPVYEACLGGCLAIVDTGTSGIAVPEALYADLLRAVTAGMYMRYNPHNTFH